LGIKHPILLAPMGGASGGKLAAAVSDAGGLGMIGGAYGVPDVLEREFGAAGNTQVGCGFITWALAHRPEALDQAISQAPAAIMLSFGDAGPFLGKIRTAGIISICQVQSLRQARGHWIRAPISSSLKAPKRAGMAQCGLHWPASSEKPSDAHGRPRVLLPASQLRTLPLLIREALHQIPLAALDPPVPTRSASPIMRSRSAARPPSQERAAISFG
jgi:hypothetical protein